MHVGTLPQAFIGEATDEVDGATWLNKPKGEGWRKSKHTHTVDGIFGNKKQSDTPDDAVGYDTFATDENDTVVGSPASSDESSNHEDEVQRLRSGRAKPPKWNYVDDLVQQKFFLYRTSGNYVIPTFTEMQNIVL